MTLAARLEDLEVTLEHMLMDVFVSLPTLTIVQSIVFNHDNCFICHKVRLTEFIFSLLSPFIIAFGDERPTYVRVSFQMLCH